MRALITQETDDIPIISTGMQNAGGDSDLVITIDDAGYYVIKMLGAGKPPNICTERFTNIHFAREGLAKYRAENLNRFEMRERYQKKNAESADR